jgi:hypothetical protein
VIITRMTHLPRRTAVGHDVPRQHSRGFVQGRSEEVKMLKKAAAVTLMASGIAAAGAGVATAQSGAVGGAVGSPGVVSGNDVQVPVHVPVNATGNSVNVIGLLNPVFGNASANG